MKKIPYGIIDYKLLQEENYDYVDKTMYLQKLEDIGRTLIYLRPGRFGKSLFTSMMSYYYDVNSEILFESLFKSTYVYNNPTPNKNNYYVLKFDFSGITTDHKEIKDLEERFKVCIITGINSFLKKYQVSLTIKEEADPASLLKYFLNDVSTLNLEHKIYILIDEYDNFTNGILSGDGEYFKSAVGNNGFVKPFYATIKEYVGLGVVDRVFITGICPITMDSMTTGFNIATNISTDVRFTSMIGLTHDEVKNLMSDIEEEQREKLYDLMLKNYDGYLFSKKSKERIFNATLVMYFLKNYYDFKEIPENLIDTNIVANYGKIENLVKLQNNSFYEDILNQTLKTGEISGELKTSFNLETDFTRDDIISLLYYFGYLTIKDVDILTNRINFKIPNKIMIETYNNFFIEILREINIRIIPEEENVRSCLSEVVEKGTIKNITNYVSEILSYSDNRIFIKFDEKYIALLYFTVLRYNNLINVYSEYPCKTGYIDLYLESKHELAKYNIMIELKYIKKSEYQEKLFEEKRREGIEQLISYSKDERINKNLKRYLVIFVGNDCKVLEEV